MRPKRLLILILIGMLLLSACQAATPIPPTATVPPPPTETPIPPTKTPIPPTETPAVPVFEIVGLDGSTTSFTMDQIRALPVTSGKAGTKSSTGKITPPETWTGVAFKDIVALIPNFDETMGINVEASDGYAITFSYDQIMNGAFTQYDPGTGSELKTPFELTPIFAYELNGEPLDPERSGDLRVQVLSDEPKQVVDGHWSVKFVSKIVVRSLGEEWTLQLDGQISETMDRATFESGASPTCHGISWTDGSAQEWIGIPLWLMAGRVDDEVAHEGPAYSDELAEMGYTIDLIAGDGYTVSFDSTRVTHNDNIILAYLVNGNPLPEKYFPLRLVGNDLEKSEMIGNVVQIIVHTEGMVIPEADLMVSGLVANPLAFVEDDLRAMEVVQITAVHPKKGSQDYEGVRLNSLLEMAGVDSAATCLLLTASDGFTAEVMLADITACADCLVAFTEEVGVFNLAMPGLPSNTWMKDVTKIEVLGDAAEEQPSEATEVPVEVPADADLVITGLVANMLVYKEDDLRALEVAQISAEHPKKGTQNYEGVRLSTLLQMAGVDAKAVKLVFTAGDGYSAEVFIEEVNACADCMVAFTDTPNELFLAMPGMPSSVWIKDIVTIELQ